MVDALGQRPRYATPAPRRFDGKKAMLVPVAGGDVRGAYIEDKTTLWLVALASESYDPAESGTRKVV